jgi:hypothetical protein
MGLASKFYNGIKETIKSATTKPNSQTVWSIRDNNPEDEKKTKNKQKNKFPEISHKIKTKTKEQNYSEPQNKKVKFNPALFESDHDMSLLKFVKLVVEDIKTGDYYSDNGIKGIQKPTLIIALVYIDRCKNGGLDLTETNVYK